MENNRFFPKQIFQTGLVLSLALLMLLGAVFSIALAQTPESDGQPTGESTWLILDPALSVDEILPALVVRLTILEANGQILAFDATPQRSAPNAVPGIRVEALPVNRALLEALPGVLTLADKLPPPPQENLTIQTTTIITGRVTEAISPTTAIPNILVQAYDGVTSQLLNSPGVTTNASGVYSTTVNSTFNKVKLRFTANGYGEEWYDNKSTFGTGDIITTNGTTITGTNAQLDRTNAALTGTATLTPGGAAANGVSVRLYRASDNTVVSTTMTTQGKFTFTNLTSGTYKAQFTNAGGDLIAPEFYQNANSLASASPINLSSNMTGTIAVELEKTAIITGQVTDTVTSLPITTAQVDVYEQNGTAPIATVNVDATGKYTATGFGTGSYKLRFQAGGYQTEFFDDKATLTAATVVTATAGMTRTVSEDLLPLTAAITGEVTSAVFTTTVMSNVGVSLYQLNPATQQFALLSTKDTDTNGVYSFTQVANGNYKVRVGFADDDIIPHAFKWYSNSGIITGATTITVSNSMSQTGINVQLEAGGCIAGKIIDANGVAQNGAAFTVNDVGGVPVPVFSFNGGVMATFTTSPTSDNVGQGEYLACGLPTGTYSLTCGGANVTGISVTIGQVTSNITCGGAATLYLPIILKP